MADEKQDVAVKIEPYDSQAPEIFEEIKQFISKLIPHKIEVEHIGSTAVSGLGGKGIIDVLIITKPERMQKTVELLESKGYKHNPSADVIPERLFVSGPYKYKEKELHIHLHITFFGSKEHKDKILFRDYLRQHTKETETYFRLKKQWSREAGSDAAKYTELKSSYINMILNKAKKEKQSRMPRKSY